MRILLRINLAIYRYVQYHTCRKSCKIVLNYECIAFLQVREPYSVVMYLAERLDLPHLLDLQLPEGKQTCSPSSS
jgi:hypothetical protein